MFIIYANILAADVKSLKTQFSKLMQSWGFHGRLLGPLLKIGLPIMKNVLTVLAKSVLIPLGLAATSTADQEILKNNSGSGTTILLVLNKEWKILWK